MNPFDLHVHAAPSLFPRSMDAVTLAQRYRDAGAGGFLLKHHHGSSIEAAAALQATVPSLDIFGGVVLNHFVGGVNPVAADAAAALGARMVWLPTLHADAHAHACGALGGFEFQAPSTTLQVERGIAIVTPDGQLTRAVREVIDVLEGRGVALATGHVGREEVLALHRALRTERRDLTLVVNHVFFDVPDLDLETLAGLVDDRTFFEVVELASNPSVGATTLDAVAAALRQHPDWPWILASDGGQAGNGSPIDRLLMFLANLETRGVPRRTLERAIHTHPRTVVRA